MSLLLGERWVQVIRCYFFIQANTLSLVFWARGSSDGSDCSVTSCLNQAGMMAITVSEELLRGEIMAVEEISSK